jgi:gliding motility-associated-like protein
MANIIMNKPFQIFLLSLIFFFPHFQDFAFLGKTGTEGFQTAQTEALFICPKGVETVAFEVNRSTFGFSDDNFTLSFNPDLANKKVALACDSINMRLLALVGQTPLADSIGVEILYGNPDGSASPDETFLFTGGSLRYTHNGLVYNCLVTPGLLSVQGFAGQKKLSFNLHSCLFGQDFSLVEGDTLEFTGTFSVNPDAPLPAEFKQVPGFQAFAFATLNGVQAACDTLSENFTLSDSRLQLQAATADQFPSGCQDGELVYQLTLPNNDFGVWFGNELRAAAKVDSFTLDFDPVLLQAFEGGQASAVITGHPVFGNNAFNAGSLTAFPGGRFLAKFDTLGKVPALNAVQDALFEIKIKLSPTCLAPFGGSNANGNYAADAAVFFTDRYYTGSIGDGSCLEKRVEQAPAVFFYAEPPAFSLTPITAANDSLSNDTAEWIVRICNTSPVADADLTWLAMEDTTGILSVISLENVTDIVNPVNLTLKPYGDDVFAFGPVLLRNDGVNSQDEYCADFRIRALVNQCKDFGFTLISGWNCAPFQPVNWTPALYPPCQEFSLGLFLTNLNNSPVSIDFFENTSICAGNGEETLTLAGALSSAEPLPQDTFTVKIILDVNGDSLLQIGEPVLDEIQVTGSISPAVPLPFGFSFNLTSDKTCALLVQLEAAKTDLCGQVVLVLPAPVLLNAGADQAYCEQTATTFTTKIGEGNCAAGNYQFTWSAIAPADVSMLDNQSAAAPLVAFPWENYLGETLRFILKTQRPGCSSFTFDTVSIRLNKSATGFSIADTVLLQATGCQGLASLCLDVDALQLPGLGFQINGQPYAGNILPCGTGNFALQLPPGDLKVIVTDTLLGCSDTISAKVVCTNTESISLNLLTSETDTICFSNNELTTGIQTLVNTCLDGTFVSYQLLNDTCLVVTGNEAGSETACMVACDSAGICDTTFLNISVMNPFDAGIKDTIIISEEVELCFTAGDLGLPGSLATMQNLCPTQGFGNVQFMLDQAGFCITYLGLAHGTDTACIRLCDNLGNCDTINLCIVVVPGGTIADDVFVELDTVFYCFDGFFLLGNIVQVTDVCPDKNGESVVFEIVSNCVMYYGIDDGTDTACYRIVDEFGNVAFVNFIVESLDVLSQTFCDTIFVGQKKQHCLDTLELPDDFAFIREICPGVGTGKAKFIIEPISLCVEYEGLAPGMDSTCVVVCDSSGICDTTFFCILVRPYLDLPGLGDDRDTTEKNTPVVIDFLKNDTLFGGVTDIFILDPPISGTAILNLDNSFTYVPFDPFCDRDDEFSYVACTTNGCDTATVHVYIACLELTVFTAVSPNNDGVNDYFHIAKIEGFPDNRLWIYNRWGSLVYETTSYKNKDGWPGNWGDDIDLPDGTYYFVLEWTDNGSTNVQRGYIELFR